MIPSVAFICAMIAAAIYAYCNVARASPSVPMQWSLSGKVNWSAPRAIAFLFIPALAIAVLALLASGDAVEERHLAAVGAVFLGFQLLHVILVDRWTKRKRG